MFGQIRFYIELALVIALLALAGTCYALYWRSEAAVADKKAVEKELVQAISVNRKNAETIADLQRKAEEERKLTEKEIAQSRLRDQAIEQIRKDMDNVEGANAPAGAYWDAFSERLSNAKRNH
jgi:Flp pilus assembly protein TadB